MKIMPMWVVLGVCCLAGAARAQVVPVTWDDSGTFAAELAIPAGKFIEACERLPRAATVAWSFTTASPVDFNIHFHEGERVRFPEKRAQVSQAAGVLAPRFDQDYCWMWTNPGTREVSLQLRLVKR